MTMTEVAYLDLLDTMKSPKTRGRIKRTTRPSCLI